MKVFIIAASLDERSGWGRYSRAVIDQLIVQGMDVEVCSEPAAHPAYPTISLRKLTSSPTISFLLNMIRVRRAARDADIVHAFDGWPYAIYGWGAVVGTKKKLFTSGIATYSVPPRGYSLKRMLFRVAYGRASKILSVSEYTKRRMIEGGVKPGKITVIHMGATPLPIINTEEFQKYAEQLSIERSSYPVVLTVGQVKDRKGQYETLRAVKSLRSTYPNILYVMAGNQDANYMQQIHKFIAEEQMERSVRFVQGADDRALSFLYLRCDLLALNSNTDDHNIHFEGFGLSVIEGYQFAKPAVGSAESGVQEAIQDSVTGLHSKQGDSEDIAHKIELILEGYETYSNNAKAAYKNYSWKDTVEAYIREYRRD